VGLSVSRSKNLTRYATRSVHASARRGRKRETGNPNINCGIILVGILKKLGLYVDCIVCGLNCVWTELCVDCIVCGLNCVWTALCVDCIVRGLN